MPHPAIKKIASRQDLEFDEARALMMSVGRGELSDVEVAAVLAGMKVKGETVDEIAGCAMAFRDLAVNVPHDLDSVIFDCCGTGGDGAGTFNISTAAAFVTAAVGVKTAKHGNRAVSSKSGSADVLEALGVKIDISSQSAARCLTETDFCFLFAPAYHPAMKHVAPVRKQLGIPTLFNLLGPLLNPARCTHQIIGTTDKEKARIISEVAGRMGLSNITTLTNSTGLDELTTGAECFLFSSNSHGAEGTSLLIRGEHEPVLELLAGGDASDNAEITRQIFSGERSYRSGVVELNAAIGLVQTGICGTLENAMEMCRETLQSGKVLDKLDQVIALTNRLE
jgi:anthranilate phosphoribosyltransferase